MTDIDIVERLRNRNTPFGWTELADKAADEIVQLRATLASDWIQGKDETIRENSDAVIRRQGAEIKRLLAQLPDGMKHCTIQFKECEKGHGRLTATNWIDHGCPQCEIERLQTMLAASEQLKRGYFDEIEWLRSEAEAWKQTAQRFEKAAAAYDAALDRIAGGDGYYPEIAMAKMRAIRNEYR